MKRSDTYRAIIMAVMAIVIGTILAFTMKNIFLFFGLFYLTYLT